MGFGQGTGEDIMIHSFASDSSRYAGAIEASRRLRQEIEADVIRGRDLDFAESFLPAGLSLVDELEFLGSADGRLLSHIQARTYAGMVGLAKRFFAAKMLDMTRSHWLGDQSVLEALVRCSHQQLEHQALFGRIGEMLDAAMPLGYVFVTEPNAVATAVLGKSTWSVLALSLSVELFAQAHYRSSIEPDSELSTFWKDVFLFHWKEEPRHAILNEREFQRADRLLDTRERDAAVEDLVDLVQSLDSVLQLQARADAAYFAAISAARFSPAQQVDVRLTILKAYRWQYLVSGLTHPRFTRVLSRMLDETQWKQIEQALAPLAYAAPRGSFIEQLGHARQPAPSVAPLMAA